MKKSLFPLLGLAVLLIVMPACEKDDPPDEEVMCLNIDELKSEKWSRSGSEPINLANKLTTITGNDGSEYLKCRFMLECENVCPDDPVNVEIKFEYNNDFPAGYDYAITDLKIEALFREYHWNESSNDESFSKNIIPISFQGSGKGSANGQYRDISPYTTDALYGQIAALIDFTFRIKNPDKPSEPKEVLERILSSVEINISYTM